MSSINRELSNEVVGESSGAGKREETELADTPTESPAQVSSEGTILEDADTERYKSVTISSATATNEEWETILSILDTPSLAEPVKEVCLHFDSNFPNRGGENFRPYEIETEADRRTERIFKEVISAQKWWPEEAAGLLLALMHRDSDALVAVLLPMCPNVEHLRVKELIHVVPTVLELEDTPAPPYAITVTHLRLWPCLKYRDFHYTNYSFELFETYAKLPRLTHLAMSGIGGIHVEDSGSYVEIPKYASPVKNIIVKKSQMGSECLRHVIKFAKKDQLESFTYQTGGLASPDTSGAIIELPLIWATLTHHSRTLRKLDLDLDYQIPAQLPTKYPGDSEYEEDSDSDDIELEHPPFQNLTCLRIGIIALMEFMIPPQSSTRLADVLPPGLEELIIRGYDKSNAEDEVKSQLEEVRALMGTGRLSKLVTLKGIDELIENGEDYVGEEDEWKDDGETAGEEIWN